MVQGILLALLQREKTGVGQKVSVSLYNSMLAMQMQEAAMHLMRGREVNWGAMPLSGVFETTDGALVMVGAFKANPLQRHLHARSSIARPVGRSALRDPRRADRATSPRCSACSASASGPTRTAHWLARLEEQDLLCAPVRTCARRWSTSRRAINDMIVRWRRRRGRDR